MGKIFLIRISILSLAFFVLPPLMQYLGTEVFKLKFIGISIYGHDESSHIKIAQSNKVSYLR